MITEILKGAPVKVFDFDAVIDSWPFSPKKSMSGIMIVWGREISVTASLYKRGEKKALPSHFFIHIHTVQPISLKWMDPFQIRESKGRSTLTKGRILHPFEGEIKQSKVKNRLELLQELMSGEKEMVLAMAKSLGFKGLAEKELLAFTRLSKKTLLSIGKQLEEEGKVRILSFVPLFLLTQNSFDALCMRILAFLSDFHTKHPEDFGVLPERIQKRFGLSSRVCALALKHLSREGKICNEKGNVALIDFYPHPSSEEEKLLMEMEAMYLDGKLHSVSLDELQKSFRLSKKKLHRLLSFLVERQKIVLGKDGFLLHSKWLDEVIRTVRGSNKKELSVSDFKQMTGLTRKYSIPLLELLDRLGVTRRKGAGREVIREEDKKG